MKLQPLDIHHKEFHRSIRGYNEEEVDVFLDEVADEFERLFRENVSLQEQIEDIKSKMTQYETIEKTLQNTLFTAQKTAEELQNNATKESELILRDAELKAKDMIQQALAEKQRIQQIFLRIKQAEEEFRMKFKTLLEDYGKLVKEIPIPEDILLLTTPSEDGGDTESVAAALVLDAPSVEELASKPETGAQTDAEPATEAVVEEAPAGEAPTEPAVEPSTESSASEPADISAADTGEMPPLAEDEAVVAPASDDGEPSDAQASAEQEAAPSAEPLLSSDVSTVSSDDGSVRGLTLGEVDEKAELGDDIDLPDFLKDPVDRTDDERQRLSEHGSSPDILSERDEDNDIEEIS